MPLQTVSVLIVIIYVSLPTGQKASFPHKENFLYTEYPEVTANMVGPSTTLSGSKGKQPTVNSDESDTELEGVYRYIHTRTGVVAPIDYSAQTRGIEVSESHFAIAESQASNSSVEKEAFAYMANNLEEMARCFE